MVREDASKVEWIKYVEGDQRKVALPVTRPKLWHMYEVSAELFWNVKEILMADDVRHWTTLSDGEKHCIEFILSFFAEADGLVCDNINERFLEDIDIYEVTRFYNFQQTMEDIHALTYAIQLDAIVPDAARREFLLNGAKNIPVIGRMREYIIRCMSSDAPFPERALRMAMVEGLFFQSCFLIIYWFGRQGKMPGLCQANELIARDECMHTQFALQLLMLVQPKYKLTTAETHEIVREAVEIACAFARDAVPNGIPELNYALMVPYIQNCADVILADIGVPLLYRVKHTFEWMDLINLKHKTNFFERRVSEYSKSTEAPTNAIDEDF